MATGRVGAETADGDGSRARQRGQQADRMTGGRMFQLPAVGVEETSPDPWIVDARLLNRPQQPGAGRDDREPDVEIVVFFPATPRHASGRIARRPDAQPFSPSGLVTNTERAHAGTHVTQRTTQGPSARRVFDRKSLCLSAAQRRYSARRTLIGSTLVARHTGTSAAIAAATPTTQVAVPAGDVSSMNHLRVPSPES